MEKKSLFEISMKCPKVTLKNLRSILDMIKEINYEIAQGFNVEEQRYLTEKELKDLNTPPFLR